MSSPITLDMSTVICLILVAHWLADFVFQTDTMAKGKSKSSWILGHHVLVYSFTMTAPAVLFMPSTSAACLFLALNAAAHFVTDWLTSRWTSRLRAEGHIHAFFVVIGLDQLIHTVTLIASAAAILGGVS